MENIYVGIYVKDNEIYDVIAGVDKNTIIKEMVEIVGEVFDKKYDKASVFLNNEAIWCY